MGDSENESKPPVADQKNAPAAGTTDIHAVARKFLQDEAVKGATRARKVEYLKEKGLDEEDINALLDESEGPSEDAHAQAQAQAPDSRAQPAEQTERPFPETHDDVLPRPQTDIPPIITYPEFLAKPPRPPPLVTGTAILNTLYACAGLTTLVYGTSKYVVAHMVDDLTEARYDLHNTVADKLSAITRLLESTVSEIPPTTSAARPDPFRDTDSIVSSDAEDPTELFHRDIGVQTSLPASPADPSTPPASSSLPELHASRLASLTASLKDLQDASVSQSEELADVKAVMDLFKDDLGTMTFPGPTGDIVGGFSLYGSKKNEPEDEIKKARDNIRRVKGVMLSTRNFPASTR